MPAEFPPEIFGDIFFHLRASIDFTSLHACTQVNSSFCALAEPHLYYHLIVSDRDPYDKSPPKYADDTLYLGHSPSQILQLLADKPYIVTKGYVRSLKLMIEASRLAGGDISDEARHLYDTELARLLPLLTSLERVVVGQRGFGGLQLTRLTEDPELQRAFYEVLGLPSVREVSMEGFNDFPLEIFQVSTMLRRLRLECHLAMSAPSGLDLALRARTATTSWRRPTLSSLALNHVRTVPRFLSWVNSTRGCDLSALENFQASISFTSDCMYIAYILSLCSGSLKTLELTSSPWPAVTNFVYDFDTEDQNNSQRRHLQELGFQPHPFSFTPSTFSLSEPISLSVPFSLACLSSLEHFRLYLPIRSFTPHSDPSAIRPVYSAPFEFIRGVLEEITAGRLRQSESSNSGMAQDLERDGENTDCSDRRIPLARLTLDIRFDEEFMTDPSLLRRISWKPLASALSEFREEMPLLKRIELRAIVEGLVMKQKIYDQWLENVLEMWNTDVHLTPLIRAELLRISGARVDSPTHCL